MPTQLQARLGYISKVRTHTKALLETFKELSDLLGAHTDLNLLTLIVASDFTGNEIHQDITETVWDAGVTALTSLNTALNTGNTLRDLRRMRSNE